MIKTLRLQFAAAIFSLAGVNQIHAEEFGLVGQSPCGNSIAHLESEYATNQKFVELVDAVFAHVRPAPPDYPEGNPWTGKKFRDLVLFLKDWCVFLPESKGSHDDGLKYIRDFAWLYYKNRYGLDFVRKPPGREILQAFVRQRGAFMDSTASALKIGKWIATARTEMEDYALPDPDAPDGGYKSFNEFFARTLKDQNRSRPQTLPGRGYVISAPTDCVMNAVPQPLDGRGAKIPVKLGQRLNVDELLGGSKHAERFAGGSALSCVLKPNTYHHYHAPVSGRIVETGMVHDGFFGYDNFPVWVPRRGNPGYHGTDFGQFEHFQRGYFIVDTGKYGHVALVAVGLNTISSVVFEPRFEKIDRPMPVERGDRLGHFLYGGSLVLLLFEPGRYRSGAVQVRLGNQIGVFDSVDGE
ncbi:MAG: phosphatidylserine decarboxylase [Gammaproteobacteria bacterium]